MPEPTHREASPRPETPERESGRTRLWRALRSSSRTQVAVAVVLSLVGCGAVIQMRQTEADDDYAGYREQDLILVLNGLGSTTQRTEDEIRRLERTRRDLQDESKARETAIEEATQREQSLAMLAGTVPVEGPGLRITITPGEEAIDLSTLLDTVQELRAADAEAMEFNDSVRLIAQSSFNEEDGEITLDGQPLETPYVIDVIGEPHLLRGAMTFRQGPVAGVEEDGGTVEMTGDDEQIRIMSRRELSPQEYADPEQ